ncbi:hypothetical protein KP509_31G066600 [Ceratopteris richardii]|nr:hypothetical protein KP509_31G066600 [Ceratopteris richardii]
MQGAKRLPFCYQRKINWTHNVKQFHRCSIQAFSAVGIVHNQAHTELNSQGSRKRGRPKKDNSSHGGKSHELSASIENLDSENGKQESAQGSSTFQRHLFQYRDDTANVFYEQFDSESEVSEALVKFVSELSKKSIDSHGWFTIALPGGSLVKLLKALVDDPSIDWMKWHVFWVDERVVPLNDNDSNFKLAMGMFLSRVKIPKNQVHHIKYGNDAKIVAKKYDQLMRGLVRRKILRLDSFNLFPQFDMILLGIGPDGHIASLFPNSLQLAEEREWVVAVLHSPKPPSERISMTLPCINAASHVCFAVVGSGKAEVIQRIMEKPALPGALPAQMVRPSNGVVYWFVDKAAAENLSVDAWGDPKKFPAMKYQDEKSR